MNLDTLPYKTFQKLKEKYPSKMILVSDRDLTAGLVTITFKDHREYIMHRFKQEGVIVTRFAHEYSSLDTSDPKMGLVFMVNDSVINPGLEVWALIGHNARYKSE